MSAKAFCICRRLLLPGLAVLLTLLLCLSAWLLADGGPSPLRTAPATPDIRTNAETGSFPFRCVVIDAGHGGEDGGAQSRISCCMTRRGTIGAGKRRWIWLPGWR